MGETRVDLLHLLEDLRDAYPGSLEETILTEIVANALDSGASEIALATDPAAATFTVIDGGSGMKRRELARYHDIAASTKVRGHGIGFAGVGIKLGLLLSEEVTTETRRRTTHVATRWHLASRNRAPWKWAPPPGLVAERGTAVRLRLRNALSPLLDAGYVEASLARHFQPLLDPAFDAILEPHYKKGVRFRINGEPAPRGPSSAAEVAPLAIRLGRRRKPSASGYLTRDPVPLPEDLRGLAVSTLGKVIRRGWDWLGISPASADRIGGLIEVPELAECLTLNKGDFVRTGPRGAMFLSYRKAIQETVARQLALWGDAKDEQAESRRRIARPLERDLEAVLVDLAEDFPLLSSLVEKRPGGQKRLPLGDRGAGSPHAWVAAALEDAAEGSGAIQPVPEPDAVGTAVQPFPDSIPVGLAEPEPPAGGGPAIPQLDARGIKKPVRYGLSIQFTTQPDDSELGRLIESTVWINDAHPAYQRAAASRSEGYHIALSVALALAGLAVEPAEERAFVTRFLGRWGESLERRSRRPRLAGRR